MKIYQSKNQKAIGDIRNQIIDSADLDKFNSFLSKYEVIDFENAGQQEEMSRCCGGDNCCKNVNFTTTINT